MTTKRMEELNRRTRIVQLLQDRECVRDIAKSERVSAKYIRILAASESIQACNHLNRGFRCIKPTS